MELGLELPLDKHYQLGNQTLPKEENYILVLNRANEVQIYCVICQSKHTNVIVYLLLILSGTHVSLRWALKCKFLISNKLKRDAEYNHPLNYLN